MSRKKQLFVVLKDNSRRALEEFSSANSSQETLPKKLLGGKKKRSTNPIDSEEDAPLELTPPKNTKKCLENSSSLKKVHQPPTPQTLDSTPLKIKNNENKMYLKINPLTDEEDQEFFEPPFDDILIEINSKYEKEKDLLTKDYLNPKENFPILNRRNRFYICWAFLDFCLKTRAERSKKTYYMAINLFDIFFTKKKPKENFSKNDLFLQSFVCFMIADKFEEVQPLGIKSYINAINFYSNSNFCDMEMVSSCEILILKELGWKIDYFNIFDWSEILLIRWTNFMNEIYRVYNLEVKENSDNKFKLLFYYFIDTIILDYDCKIKDMKHIAICVLYILLNFNLNLLDKSNETSTLISSNEKKNLEDKAKDLRSFSKFFELFLDYNKNLEVKNFYQYLDYVEQFMSVKILVTIYNKFETCSPDKVQKYWVIQDHDNSENIKSEIVLNLYGENCK